MVASSAPSFRRPHIILVRPTEQGNVGAAARAMANMGLRQLVLVEPAPRLEDVARAFAVGAGHILDGVRRVPSLDAALAPYQRVVGTTSSRDRRLGDKVPPLTARQLPAALAADAPGTATALVFGPEASGLTDAELSRCHPLVSVPCAPRQPTLNLAQAVLLLAYELWQDGPGASPDAGDEDRTAAAAPGAAPGVEAPPAVAPAAAVAGLLEHGRRAMEAVGFARDDTFEAVLRDLARLAARAGLQEREVSILHGVCRRTLHAVAGARAAASGGGEGTE